MGRIVYQSKGLDSLISDMEGYAKELNKEIDIAITNNLEDVQKHARKNHRFDSKTGELEKSVQVEQSTKGNTHNAKVFLNDSRTTTTSKKSGERSYGVFIHEGTYEGYNRSPIAPLYSHSSSKSGSGWKGDPFLWRALQKKWKLTRDLKKLTTKLKKKYERV